MLEFTISLQIKSKPKYFFFYSKYDVTPHHRDSFDISKKYWEVLDQFHAQFRR